VGFFYFSLLKECPVKNQTFSNEDNPLSIVNYLANNFPEYFNASKSKLERIVIYLDLCTEKMVG